MCIQKTVFALAGGVAMSVGLASVAQAQSLTMALAEEPTAADPQYHKMTANDAFSAHVYDSLVGRNANMELVPGLVLSY
jgi:peptide/nickel transport system substrate-binding protein